MLRLLLIVLSTVNSYARYECGVPHFQILDRSGRNRIVGGWEARPHSIPWQVYMIKYRPSTNRYYTCGGALLEPDRMNGTDIVLTAAHCVRYNDDKIYAKSKNLRVIVGAHKLWSKEEKSQREIKVKMYDHHNYRSEDHANDIAILNLKETVFYTEYTRPICYPVRNQELPVNSKCFVSGWGSLSEHGGRTDVLQMVDVKIYTKEKCPLPDNLRKLMFCAGYEEGGKDSCQGDSGGPLMCEENGKWVLFGVVSHGRGCARPGDPGMYTKVATYVDWIQQKMVKYAKAKRMDAAENPAKYYNNEDAIERKFDSSSYERQL